jgi:hypothetical protein
MRALTFLAPLWLICALVAPASAQQVVTGTGESASTPPPATADSAALERGAPAQAARPAAHTPETAPPATPATAPTTASPEGGAQSELMLEIDDPSARLDAWLLGPPPDLTMQHWMSGVLAVGGATALGIGVAMFADPGLISLDAVRYPLGRSAYPALLTIGGAAWLTMGIMGLIAEPFVLDSVEAWRSARGGPNEHDERLRVEGELRSAARWARGLRMVSLVSRGVTGAGFLAALLSFAAGPYQEGDRLILSVASGAGLLGALLGALMDLSPGPLEERWSLYQRGLAPRREAPSTLQVVPLVSGELIGLSAGGTF